MPDKREHRAQYEVWREPDGLRVDVMRLCAAHLGSAIQAREARFIVPWIARRFAPSMAPACDEANEETPVRGRILHGDDTE